MSLPTAARSEPVLQSGFVMRICFYLCPAGVAKPYDASRYPWIDLFFLDIEDIKKAGK